MKRSPAECRTALHAHMRAIADADGIVARVSVDQFARALGEDYRAVAAAMRDLMALGAVERFGPRRPAAPCPPHRRTPAPSWHIDAAVPIPEDFMPDMVAPSTGQPLAKQAFSVERADNVRVSIGLLVRLLKFHGDKPPDRRSASAVAQFRRQFPSACTLPPSRRGTPALA